MGNTNCCHSNTCKGSPEKAGYKSPLLDFQNYSKPFGGLDRYDQFYRIACFPLHCLQAHAFFAELDQLQRIVDVSLGYRVDSDLVPVRAFNEYFFEGEALWTQLLLERDCVIKRMLYLNGLFVSKVENVEVNETEGVKKHQSNDSTYDDNADEKSVVISLEANKYCPSQNDQLKEPEVIQTQFLGSSFHKGPELDTYFKQKMEPSFVRIDQGVLRKNGETVQAEPQIDLFAIKILAILMCRDLPKIKASLFLDTVIGRQGITLGREFLSINNPNLKKAFKLLLYFSEVFPKKYEDEFQLELEKAYSGKKLNPVQREADISEKEYEMSTQLAPSERVKESGVTWRPDYVQGMEKFLRTSSRSFDDLYEIVFVQVVFSDIDDFSSKFDSGFNRKQFQKRIKNNEWLFQPAQLRARLIKNLLISVD